MADRLFTRANLVTRTHVQLGFRLGHSRSGPTDLSVTLPVENARLLVAQLGELLTESPRPAEIVGTDRNSPDGKRVDLKLDFRFGAEPREASLSIRSAFARTFPEQEEADFEEAVRRAAEALLATNTSK